MGNAAASTSYVLLSGFHAAADFNGNALKDFLDNCVEVANADQVDIDGDHIGNTCDCDFNQDGFCGFPDFNLFIGGYNRDTGTRRAGTLIQVRFWPDSDQETDSR